MIKEIHLYGDSILDNGSYVEQGSSVLHQLKKIDNNINFQLLAVDGDCARHTLEVLDAIQHPHDEEIGAVLSVGGNDALAMSNMMFDPVDTVAAAFGHIRQPLEEFRKEYEKVLKSLTLLYRLENIRVCTIYNKIPTQLLSHVGIGPNEMMGLALFNDIITETAASYGISIIDLRVVCATADCYASISPIEPSEIGGMKIAKQIISEFVYEKAYDYVR